ncbi:MGMT family protein, partial [Solemya elarraichensis gill symbiont]
QGVRGNKGCRRSSVKGRLGCPVLHHEIKDTLVLHVYSRKEKLPWHRVINREGKISLKPFRGYEEQKLLLETEDVEFGIGDRIDLEDYLWDEDVSK